MKIVLLICGLLTSLAHAEDSLSTKIHNQYTSFRAMGMGNAFVAVADDYSLMFYNPAGFAKKRYNEFQFTMVGAGYSPKTVKLMDDIKKATETGTESQKASAVSAVLDQYYGQSLGGTVQAVEIFWTRRHWGIALLPVNLTVDMSFNKQLGPAIDLNIIGDTVIAYGYGNDISKTVSMGASVKYLHRVSVDQSVSALELASDPNVLSTKRAKEGISLDLDIGMMWTPNWFNSNATKAETVTESVIEVQPEPKLEEEKKRTPQSEINVKAATQFKLKETNATDPPIPLRPEDIKVVPSVEYVESPLELKDESNQVTFPDNEIDEPIKVKPKARVRRRTKIVEVIPAVTERFPLTFGLVVRNVAGGSFSKSKMVNKDATDEPAKLPTTLDLGSQYELAKFGDLTFRTMIDIKNIFHPDINPTKAFHAGFEADYYPNSWFKTQFRAGLNQNYYTAGVTLLLGFIQIDALTYGEEVGTTATKIENRVYAGKLGFNF
ncbi:MAG: hypothetical protein H7061_11805 [Bdellovibrionaceae bacterium]|nr:hypothetical protein [Bdellovibrio sp.]